ncbi:hypothetical protein [Ammoniphilus sp. CFH 90114]|uniref:hypothetical protein n=1 Tax=Ammoniphilus sp. CFH 90114 TaxID=2493665 RepID=UPI00100FDA9C|nr:hypothetical protein [Ammoniphilus sp. CFH 90114]RXT08103.1 hypothetical protein EIZ39_11890 [Ammoniphilus sp. CFH 90114]
MNTHRHPIEPQFPYDFSHVHFDSKQEGDLHVVDISIDDRLVNRKLFFSSQEASIHLFNLNIAIQLGATFNEEGYWAFENYPPHKRKLLEKQYYRLSKG